MINKVSLFMALMGQEMPDKPTIPSEAIVALRSSLIEEENMELRFGAQAKDIVEVADALCDLQYVVSGAVRAYGFSPELFEELFEEVHASNMSKLCHSMEEAANTGDYYTTQGIATYPKEVDGKFAIIRISDDKVMKSINWKEPNLKRILLKHGVKC